MDGQTSSVMARQLAARGGLAFGALVALWLDARAHRALGEILPPVAGPLPTPAPSVSIVLPVRDEEAHIDAALAALLAQDYPTFDVTVVDDGSTDMTPRLLEAWAARDARVRIHRVAALPAGWAGKAHALHAGVALSRGEWLLFTDADTRHAPRTLRLTVRQAVGQGADLLSLLPDLALRGAGMRLLTPIGTLLLFARATPAEVADVAHPRAWAVGQYLLVRRAAYEAIGGYATPGVRGSFAEDVALAEVIKRAGYRVALVSGRGLVASTQWTTWPEAWRGWRKSAYGVVAARPLVGLGAGLALLAYGFAPPLALRPVGRRGDRWAPLLGAVTVVTQIDAYRRVARALDVSWPWPVAAPVGWAAFGALLLDCARLALTGRGAVWKGRNAPLPQARAT